MTTSSTGISAIVRFSSILLAVKSLITSPSSPQTFYSPLHHLSLSLTIVSPLTGPINIWPDTRPIISWPLLPATYKLYNVHHILLF